MLRTTATRSLVRSFARSPAVRSSYSAASAPTRNAIPPRQLNNKRPQLSPQLSRPTTTSLLYTTKSPYDKIDVEAERRIGQKKVESRPEEVSTTSTLRPTFESPQSYVDPATPTSVWTDVKTIKDTFQLRDVPRQPLYLGLAGVLPYAATCLSTVFLAFDINRAKVVGSGLVFAPETAHRLLDFVTPIQIGYGAVVSGQDVHVNRPG